MAHGKKGPEQAKAGCGEDLLPSSAITKTEGKQLEHFLFSEDNLWQIHGRDEEQVCLTSLPHSSSPPPFSFTTGVTGLRPVLHKGSLNCQCQADSKTHQVYISKMQEHR